MGRGRKATRKRKKSSNKQQQKSKDKMTAKDASNTSDNATTEYSADSSSATTLHRVEPRPLNNLGNTCFMNSVLQILCRIVPLRKHFISHPAPPGEGPLTAGLRAVFLAQSENGNNGNNNYDAFAPSKLFAQLGKINPVYKLRRQQDSQEVLALIVDTVKEEEKARLAKAYRKAQASSPCDSSAGSTFSDAEATATIDSNSNINHNKSTIGYEDVNVPEEDEEDEIDDKPIPESKLVTIIDRVMGGKYTSNITCLTCRNKSPRFEAFHDVPLALHPRDAPDPDPQPTYPDDPAHENKNNNNNDNNSKKNNRNPSKKQNKGKGKNKNNKGKHKNNRKKRKGNHGNPKPADASDSSLEYKDANNPSTAVEHDSENNITPSEDIIIPSLFDDSDDADVNAPAAPSPSGFPVYGPFLPESSTSDYPVYGPALPDSGCGASTTSPPPPPPPPPCRKIQPSAGNNCNNAPPPPPPPPPPSFSPGNNNTTLTGKDSEAPTFQEQLLIQSDLLTPSICNINDNAAPRLGEVPTNTLISTDLSELDYDEPHLVPDGAVIALGPPVQLNNSNSNNNASSDLDFFGVSDDEEPPFLQSMWGDDDDNSVENKNENTNNVADNNNDNNGATNANGAANAADETTTSTTTSQFKAGVSAFMNIFSPSKAPYGYGSIEDSLLLSVQPETLDGDNKVVCEKCSRKARLESAKANKKKKKARKAATTATSDGMKQCKAGPASPNNLRDCIRSKFGQDNSNINGEGLEEEHNGATTSDEEKMPLLPPTACDEERLENEDGNKGATSPVTVSVSSASSSSDEEYETTRDEEDEEKEKALIEKYATDPTLEVRSAAQMQVLVDTAPEALILHLKRFFQPAYGRIRKISGHVKFPLTLDLAKYMDRDEDLNSNNNINYQLTGISVHQGGYSGGHYIAYVRDLVDDNIWYYCSDSIVKRASLKEVMQCDAYLLSYSKVSS